MENLFTIAFSHVASKPNDSEEDVVRSLAYHLWEERGCPIGEPDQDWALAQDLYQQVKSRTSAKTEVPYPTQQAICFRYRQGGVSQKQLANRLGVTLWEVRKALGTTGKTATL